MVPVPGSDWPLRPKCQALIGYRLGSLFLLGGIVAVRPEQPPSFNQQMFLAQCSTPETYLPAAVRNWCLCVWGAGTEKAERDCLFVTQLLCVEMGITT